MTQIDSRTISMSSIHRFLFAALAVAAVTLTASQHVNAQRHQLIDGNEAPGMAAQKMILGNPRLASYSQSVEIFAPEKCEISAANGNGFGKIFTGQFNARLNIGPVYRLKIGNLPAELELPAGTAVYPSIELVDRLYPPNGLADKFPIEIVLTKDDLVQAVAGKLVTKIIYLEDPETALAIRQRSGDQSTIDVGMAADPYQTADQLGRPMAIIRIGSRIPNPADLDGEFHFNTPAPKLMARPQVTRTQPQYTTPPSRLSDSTLSQNRLPKPIAPAATETVNPSPNWKLPPIVQGNAVRQAPNRLQK